ncbi:MAG: beta-N-acetylglucosaminidase domain-containing protein [Planctomycetota bacterium]|nr:beta-N-acetylglucosaminidase domain-containing protein [Planctomycetota bacterium]
MQTLDRCALLLLLAALPLCAAEGLQAPPIEGGVLLEKIGADYLPGDLEWAVTPRPQQEAWTGVALPVLKVVVVLGEGLPEQAGTQLQELFDAAPIPEASFKDEPASGTVLVIAGVPESSPRAKAALEAFGLAQAYAALDSDEGYVLGAGTPGGRATILLAGRGPWGSFWGVQSLRQLTRVHDGAPHVRAGVVADFPRFPFRGNKRPEPWEHRFKANYGWNYKGSQKCAHLGRRFGAWIHHVDPLDATDARLDLLIDGGEVTEKGKTERFEGAKAAYEKGCREFVLKYDDTGTRMNKATEERFGGDYFKAQSHFLTEMFKRLRALDPANRVFFMPQPYWLNCPGIEAYASKLGAAGGIPSEMGLSFCGIEVFSQILPTGAIDAYRGLFGSTVRAQIYDNVGRGGDLFAITGRDPDLWKSVECIFPERGTPVTRITVYDYLWNPEGYEPERALALACRELSGGNPEACRALRSFVEAWNARRDPAAGNLPRERALADYAAATGEFDALWSALEPLLKDNPLAAETRLAGVILGKLNEWGECDALATRRAQTPVFTRYGLRELKVAKLEGSIALDGKLDEAAWAKAEVQTGFIPHGWGKEPAAEPLAEDDQAALRVLRDDTHLYLALEAHSTKELKLPDWAAKQWKDAKPGATVPYAWRVPCFELFLDTDHDHADYYQLVMNVANFRYEVHAGDWNPAHPLPEVWASGAEFKLALAEDLHGATLECRLPFANLGGAPKPGARWGLQIHKSIGAFGLWTYQFAPTSFSHGPSQLGHLVFE